MKKVLIIGGGSFGTALTILLANKGHKCYIYEFNEKYRELLKKDRMNKTFLDGYKLPDSVSIVDDYNEKVLDVDIILLATPTQFVRNIVTNMKKLNKGQIIVNVSKGIEMNTLKRVSEVLEEELKEKDFNYVLLAGPTHAEEISKQVPSAILSVSKNEEIAKIVQETFNTSYLRVYTGTDVVGAELAGALKNCIAIFAGMTDGLGFGDNAKAAIMTRGIGEMLKIADHFNACQTTFMGLTGIGDLIVTCISKHSRNRYLGEQIGKGRKVDEIIKEMKMVAEGASTIKALKVIIDQNNLRTPVLNALYDVLYNDKQAKTIIENFMNRDLKSEF